MVGRRDEEESGLNEFLATGLEVGSSVAGAAAGFALGGMPGLMAGAAAPPVLGHALRWAARELAHRRLSEREGARAVTALDFATTEVRRRLERGETIREDGFFGDAGGHGPAEEVLEGALLAAQRSFEEGKVPFLGRLYAAIAFDSTLTRPIANYLIRLVDELSYSQLLAIAVFTMNSQPEGILQLSDRLLEAEGQTLRGQQMAHEIMDLYNRALLKQLSSNPDGTTEAILGPVQISPARTRPQGFGMKLSTTAHLIGAPGQELAETAQALGSPLPRETFGN